MAVGDSTRELRKFIRDMGKIPPDIRQELRPRLRKIGEKALLQAKANASWSTRIPAATRLQVSLSKSSAGIALVVNSKRAPHARYYENDGKPGTFRHPLFGNRKHWFTQAARPFLLPAARPWDRQIDQEIGEVVDSVARDQGFQ